jgi:hypothetical protein
MVWLGNILQALSHKETAEMFRHIMSVKNGMQGNVKYFYKKKEPIIF